MEQRAKGRASANYQAVWVGADDEVLHRGRIVNVSEHGIGLETNDALVPGQVITLKARRKPELPALAARVMWSNDHQAGLRILRERPEGAAAWRFAFANQAA